MVMVRLMFSHCEDNIDSVCCYYLLQPILVYLCAYSIDNSIFLCPSSPAYTDPCPVNFCQNGGTCVCVVGQPNSFRCMCLPGFSGTNCQLGKSHAFHMGITCTQHGYHMHTTRVSHAYHMHTKQF